MGLNWFKRKKYIIIITSLFLIIGFIFVVFKTSDPYLNHISILKGVYKLEFLNETFVKISDEPEQYILKQIDSDIIEKKINADIQSGIIIVSDMLGGIRETKTGEKQKIKLRKYTSKYVILKIENVN